MALKIVIGHSILKSGLFLLILSCSVSAHSGELGTVPRFRGVYLVPVRDTDGASAYSSTFL